MTNAHTTYFISDLHLSPGSPLQALFLAFLQGPAREADALYILGDLFDVWLGKEFQPVFNTTIQTALSSLAKEGVSLFFMPGNRDFLVNTDFLKQSRLILLKDPTMISLYGTRILLSHGDSLCTQDKAYQRYRKIVRHPF